MTQPNKPFISTAVWQAWSIPFVAILVLLVYTYLHYGVNAVVIALLILFWVVCITSIIIGLRREREARALAAGQPIEPRKAKVFRTIAGCMSVPAGLVLMFLGLYPVAYIRTWANTGDKAIIDILLYLPFGIPGFFVIAMSCGLLAKEPGVKRPRITWKDVGKKALHLTGHVLIDHLAFPFVIIGFLFLWVVDLFRYE